MPGIVFKDSVDMSSNLMKTFLKKGCKHVSKQGVNMSSKMALNIFKYRVNMSSNIVQTSLQTGYEYIFKLDINMSSNIV